jgi:hypothetical protein
VNRTGTGGVFAVVAAVAATLLMISGCADSSLRPYPSASSMPSAPPGATVPAMEITATHPVARFAQNPLAEAAVIRVEVSTIVNQGRQGLTLTVAVEPAQGSPARPAEVGRVSPFPSDRGGVYTLPLRGEVADLARTAPTVLTVGVAPIATDEPLAADVRLVLSAGLAR